MPPALHPPHPPVHPEGAAPTAALRDSGARLRGRRRPFLPLKLAQQVTRRAVAWLSITDVTLLVTRVHFSCGDGSGPLTSLESNERNERNSISVSPEGSSSWERCTSVAGIC